MATPTQTKRRLTFGLNVFIAVVAAVALSVLLCWLSFHSPKRWDLTHTRQYSLSEQTLAVLTKGLTEPHELVTLFNRPTSDTPGRGEQIERANDLVDEYARRSSNLHIEHINPDLELAKVTALFERIKSRYAKPLEPMITAINKGADVAKAVKESPKRVVPLLTKLQNDPEQTNDSLREASQSFAQYFARVDSEMQKSIEQIASETAKPLPDYTGLLTALRTKLNSIDTDLARISLHLSQNSVVEKATVGVRDQLLRINEEIDKARKPIRDALTGLRSVTPVEGYERIRDQISIPDTLLIMGPKDETVVQLDEMFRQVDAKERDAMSREGIPELAFLGEERLTGALLSLSMKVRPKVVFVYSGRRPAIGASGGYNNVANRLRKLNFVVDQWTPGPRMGPMGQPAPPQPPPVAEPGQKLVWVLLPSEATDERNPMAGRLAEQAIRTVTERLNSGDSGLFMIAPAPTARFNPTDPMVQALEVYNIKPLLDRVVFREIAAERAGQTAATSQIEATTWPDALPITKAIGGLKGIFVGGVPLEVIPSQNTDVVTFPLVTLTLPGLWAEREEMNLKLAKRTPEKAADSFTIGMAAQSKSNRVVAIGDPLWATDSVTGVGIFGPGSADVAGASYPANTELFVNSMYWLAHLEDLIAASPRSQDIRRIQQMTPTTYRSVKWGLLAGLPVLALGLGIGVYMVRRRA